MNEKTITQLIYTLNQIEVHGQQNLSMLLGCVETLQLALSEIKAKEVNADG